MNLKEYLNHIANSDKEKLKKLQTIVQTIQDTEIAAVGDEDDIKKTPIGYYSVPRTSFMDAQKYSMIALAEAAKNIEPETKKQLHQVPWHKLNRIRNLFAHEIYAVQALGDEGYLQEADKLLFSGEELYQSVDAITKHLKLDEERKGLAQLINSQDPDKQPRP